jgi:hypothetical protein
MRWDRVGESVRPVIAEAVLKRAHKVVTDLGLFAEMTSGNRRLVQIAAH